MNAFKTNADVSHHKKWKEYICNQSRNEYTFLLKYWRIQYSACDETKIFCIEFILPRANWFFIEMCFFVFINYCLKMYEHLNFSGGVPVDSWSIPYFHLIMRLLNLNKMNLSKHLYFHEDGTFKISLCFFRFDLFLYWTTYAYWVIRSICVLCFMGPFRDNHTESESACRTRIWILLKHLQMRDTQIDYFCWQQQQKVKEIEKFFLLNNNSNKMRQIEKKTFEFQTLICSVTICVSNHWWRNSWIFLSKVWNNKNNKVFIPFYGRSWIWFWYRKKNWNQKKKQWKEKKRYKIYGHCVVNAIYKKTWSNQIQRQWIWIKK